MPADSIQRFIDSGRRGRQSPRNQRLLTSILAVLIISLIAVPAYLVLPVMSSGQDDSAALGLALAPGDVPVANPGVSMNITVHWDVSFDASASTPSTGATIVNYTWVFTHQNNPAFTLYGVTPHHRFNETGLFTGNLTVRDSSNLTGWAIININVLPEPKTFLERYWLTIAIAGVAALVLGYSVYIAVSRIRANIPVIADSTKEKYKLGWMRTNKVMRQLIRNPMGAIGLVILAAFVFLAAFGPMLAPYDVNQMTPNDLELPTKQHWMGTDNLGIDIFSELLYGARTSIIVGMTSALIASFLGAAVGLYSGYVGGWKDEVVMRLNDIVLSIPWLVLMIVVAAMMGTIDLTGIILIIGLTGWSTTARMVRAQVLSIRERQYIERARAIGASELAIIRRHVFPNTFPLVFANTILTVAVSILSEATLSFLGLRPVGVVTWGTMLSFASEASAFQIGLHWWILAPGLCIVIVVLGFTLLGYALDEILNPKLRHR